MPILTKSQIHLSNRRCFKYRKKILDLSQRVGALHIGGSFSCTEILEVIFSYFLKTKTEKECFILSKGHSSILQYVILEDKKILKTKDLNIFTHTKK